MFQCCIYAERYILDLVFTKKECERLPVAASLFDVEPETFKVQREVFMCLSVVVFVVVVVIIIVVVCACVCARSCTCMCVHALSVSPVHIPIAFNSGMIPLYSQDVFG
jgi:hypothetical protein